jgi:hypothetical protein
VLVKMPNKSDTEVDVMVSVVVEVGSSNVLEGLY